MGTQRFTKFWYLSLIVLTGCSSTSYDTERLVREQAATIQSLDREVRRLNGELDHVLRSQDELAAAKNDLESRLAQEVKNGGLSVAVGERGLVVTMLSSVLFDSGSNVLKHSAKTTLDKLSGVLSEKLSDHIIYVEGHTDNEPIGDEPWPSNWELSTARATEVIHYFTDELGLNSTRFVASGYGEFHPVGQNDSEEGKMLNRRVEIVVSPQKSVVPSSL